MLAIFATILILPLLNLAKGTITEYHPITFEMPVMSLLTFNLLGKMGFGALGGFDGADLRAGDRQRLKLHRVAGRPARPVISERGRLGRRCGRTGWR